MLAALWQLTLDCEARGLSTEPAVIAARKIIDAVRGQLPLFSPSPCACTIPDDCTEAGECLRAMVRKIPEPA